MVNGYFGFFSLLSGLLSLILLAFSLLPGPRTAKEQLEFHAFRRGRATASAALVLAWAVASVPFSVGVGYLIQPGGGSLDSTGIILTAAGVLMLGFALFAATGAFLSIFDSQREGSDPKFAEHEAEVWTSLRYYLTDPGLMVWGLGQVTLGWLALQSNAFPGWLSIAGIVGGAAGLATLLVFRTPKLALVQMAAFSLWGLGTFVILLANPGLLP